MKKRYGLYPGKPPQKPNRRGSQKAWTGRNKIVRYRLYDDFPKSMGATIHTLMNERP